MELLVAVLAAVLIYFVFHGINVFIQNMAVPTATEEVCLYFKESNTNTFTDKDGTVMAETAYLAHFRILSTEENVVLRVSHRIYNALPEEAEGRLTYKGTRFLSFEYAGGYVKL